MKTVTLKPLKPLLISLALLTASVPTPVRSVESPANGRGTVSDTIFNQDREVEPQQLGTTPAPKAEMGLTEQQIDERNGSRMELEWERKAAEEPGFFGISWGPLLNAGSPLLGLISLLLALAALSRVKRQREEVMKLKERYQNLLTRLGGVEVQMDQERMINRNQAISVSVPAPASTPTPSPPTQPSWSVPHPPPETNPGPEPISKATLISALNAGDRQQLRANANAELNITSESENALTMGKSIATELEEVAGGGSYWHIKAEGQNWLFPTDRTLRGFAAAHPSKGLFHYEQQTIAQPKLIEPALLERSGPRWTIKTLGRIAMP
jgi:hypothetical protein